MKRLRAGYRVCAKCGNPRHEKFFLPAGKVCSFCKRRGRRYNTRDVHLAETKGITQHEYELLLAANDGRCWICDGKRPGNLDVDHDHAVEKRLLAEGVEPARAVRLSIRGLACKRCNRRLLPAAQDSVDRLKRAIWYLTLGRERARAILDGQEERNR